MEDGICGALTPAGPDTILTVEVTAGHGRDLFPTGYNPWRKAIGCRVSAPPVGGQANRAVIGLIGATLGVPAKRVMLVSGRTSSVKRLRIAGLSIEQTCDILRSHSHDG